MVSNAARRPVFSRDQLLDQVWDYDFTGTLGLSTCISAGRGKIEDDPKNPSYIETVRFGYRLKEMMMLSIRWKLTLTYVLLVLASLLVLGVYLIRGLENYFLDNLRSQLLIEARLIGQMAEKNLESDPGEAAGFSGFAQSLADTTRVKTEMRVTIIDRNGVVWGDSAEAPQGMENHLTVRN